MNAIPKHERAGNAEPLAELEPRATQGRAAPEAAAAEAPVAPGFMPMRPSHAAHVAVELAPPPPPRAPAPEPAPAAAAVTEEAADPAPDEVPERAARPATGPRSEVEEAEAVETAPPPRSPAAGGEVPRAEARPEGAPRKGAEAAASPSVSASARAATSTVATDAENLKRFLTEGKGALARQADLIEMHRRLVEQMRVLGQGIAEIEERKAAEDRKALVARLDEVEKAVNTMEGALRIELPALLQETVDAAVARARPHRPAVVRAGGVLILLVAAFAAGVVLAPRLGDMDGPAAARLGNIFSTLSPNGGISKAGDPLE